MKNFILIFLTAAGCFHAYSASLFSSSIRCMKMRSSLEVKYDTAIVTRLSYSLEKNVVRCTFTTASEGDCPHIVFSCGDFGLAEIKLTGAALDLWNSLYSKSPSGYQPNDDYIGKVFEITYQKTSVKACDGSGDLHQVDAPRVVGFRLISSRK